MSQHIPVRFQAISRSAEFDSAPRLDRITGRILAGVVLVLLAVLLIAAELRLTPEERMGFFEATYVSP